MRSNGNGSNRTDFKARRVLSWILTIVMVFGLLPTNLLSSPDTVKLDAAAVAYEEFDAADISAFDADATEDADEAEAPDTGDEGDSDVDAYDFDIIEIIEADEDAGDEADADTEDGGADADLPDSADVDEPEADNEYPPETVIGLEDEGEEEGLLDIDFLTPGMDVPEGYMAIEALDGQIILAQAGVNVVSFYVNDELWSVQTVEDGDLAKSPGAPPASLIPTGFVSFLGWFEQGAADPFEFDTPVSGHIILEARYSNLYLVEFLDGYEKRFLSKRVTPNSMISTPTAAELLGFEIPNEKIFDYWADKDTGLPYAFGVTQVTKDTTLIPVLVDRVYIYFVSYGTEVQPIALKAGGTATQPPPPSRQNYQFNYWSAAPDGPQHNWSLPVNSDLILYAVWTPIPNSAPYKVVWWLEEPDLDHDPIPGNAADYMFVTDEIRTGTPGTSITINTLPPGPANKADRPDTDPVRYSEFQACPPVVISGAGNSYVNVYLKRVNYSFTFNLLSPSNTITMNGVTHQGSVVISYKYEQDVTDIWPSRETATFNFDFHSWLPGKSIIGGAVDNPAQMFTRRNIAAANMMPVDPNIVSGHVYNATTGALNTYNVRYWFEAYEGQTGTSRQYTANGVTKTYIIDRQYDQNNVPWLNPKDILGLVNVGTNQSATETGPGYYNPTPYAATMYPFINLYYDRNKHTLFYDMDGGPSINPVPGIMYDRPLIGFLPNPQSRPGYSFVGWYKDANRTRVFDWNDARMPPNVDLTVYAKWDSNDNIVSFYDGDTFLFDQGVQTGFPVDLQNIPYTPGMSVPGKGVLIGWLYEPLGTGIKTPYPIDMLVYRDFNLYANWNTDGNKVNYNRGDAQSGSIVPIDPYVYKLGTYARVLQAPGLIAPSPNLVFVGWRVGSAASGIIYYPGTHLLITGNMELFPVFTSSLVSLTFSNNYPASPQSITWQVMTNAQMQLPDESIFTSHPPNMVFSGWRTAPNGGTVYTLNDIYTTGTVPVTLYAYWTPNNVQLTYDGNGDLANTSVTIEVPRNQNYNVLSTAPTGLQKVGRAFIGWSLVQDNASTIITSNVFIAQDMTVYALWSDYEVRINLTFDVNGAVGETNTTTQILIHDTIYFDVLSSQFYPSGLIRYGYDHEGWSLAQNPPQGRVTSLQLDADTTVYARWINGPESFNLIFNGNGDDANTMLTVPILKHTPVTLSHHAPAVNKSGFIFDGWTTEPNNPATKITIIPSMNVNMTVYAYWVDALDYNLVFDGNGGTNGSSQSTYIASVKGNSTHQLATYAPTGVNMFQLSGFNFVGWTTERNNASTLVTSVFVGNSAVTVYALWTASPQFTITYDGNGDLDSTLYTVQATGNAYFNVNANAPANLKKVGKTLLGWSTVRDDLATLITADIYVTGARTVYALWSADDVYVNVVFDGNGDKDNTLQTESVLIHDLVNPNDLGPKNLVKYGYDFIGWSSVRDNPATLVTSIRPDTNITLYALWSDGPIYVSLVYNGNGDDANTLYTVPGGFLKHSPVVLANYAPPVNKAGYSLLGWSLTPGGAPVATISAISADTIVYAVWSDGPARNTNVVFDGNGGTNKNGNTTYTVQVLINSHHQLSAIQPTGDDMFLKAGYRFLGWTSVQGNAATLITDITVLETPVTIYALWSDVIEYTTIRFDGNGAVNQGGAGYVEVSVLINSHQVLATIQPTGNNMFTLAGYNHNGWTSIQGDASTIILDIWVYEAPVTVYALWDIIPAVTVTYDCNGDLDNTSYSVPSLRNTNFDVYANAPAGLRKVGKELLGWSLEKDNPQTLITSPVFLTGDLTVYALWSDYDVYVDITFDGNGDQDNTTVTIPVLIHDLIRPDDLGPDDLVKPGYDFNGWSTDKDDPATKIDTIRPDQDMSVYALWGDGPLYVNLIFDANGGTIPGYGVLQTVPNILKHSRVVIADHAPANVVYPGFVFEGWSLSANGSTGIVTVIDKMSVDTTVYAIWRTAPNVDLTFDGNGGTNKAGNSTFVVAAAGNSTHLLSVIQPTGDNMFTKPGYNFLGWTTVPNNPATIVTAINLSLAPVTVYALWSDGPINVQLTFFGNGGLNKLNQSLFHVDVPIYSTQLIANLEPTGDNMFRKPGSDFKGWSLTDGGPLITEVDIYYYNVILYANWEQGPDVDLIFNGNGGTNTAGNDTYAVKVPRNSTIFPATLMPTGANMFKKDGFAFAGWSETVDGPLVVAVDIGTTDKVLYAIWTAVPDVSLIFHGNGGINKAGNVIYTVNVPGYSTRTLADYAPTGDDLFRRAGYDLAGWSEYPGGPMVDTVNVNGTPKTVYAVWVAGPNVNLIFNGNGGVNKAGYNTFSVSVLRNSIQIPALIMPSGDNMFRYPGHIFLGWSETPDGQIAVTVEVDAVDKNVYAIWAEADDVYLIFSGNGGVNKVGNPVYAVYVQVNSTQTLADHAPTGDNLFRRAGYDLAGWSEYPNGPMVNTVEIYTLPKTVYAVWVAGPNVNVVFNGNGGRNAAGSETFPVSVPRNSTVIPALIMPTGGNMFTLEGHVFSGWAETPDGPIVVSIDVDTTGIELYAIWTKVDDVLLVFHGNGGVNRNGNGLVAVNVPVNSVQTLANIQPTGDDLFRRAGYDLVGWSETPGGIAVTTVNISTLPKTVYAVWAVGPNVNLIYDGNGGTNASGATTYTVSLPRNSTQYPELYEPTGANMFKRPGYVFTGWSEVRDGPVVVTVEIDTTPKTVYATWLAVPDVTLTFNGNGGVNRAGGSTFNVGVQVNSTQVIASIEPTGDDSFRRAGYALLGWSETPTGLVITEVDIGMHDKTLFAIWVAVPNVNLIFNGNGGVNDNNLNIYAVSVQVNSTQILADLEPKGANMFKLAGHQFAGWSETVGGPVVTLVDIDFATKQVYAVWEELDDVTITFDGNGGLNKAGDAIVTVNVTANTSPLLADVAPTGDNMFKNPGHTFVGWSVTRTGPVVTTLGNLTADTTVYAIWQAMPNVNLIFDANGGADSAGNDRCQASVQVNSTQNLAALQPVGNAAFKKSGHELLGWSETPNGAIVTEVDILETDKVVYAVWGAVEDVYLIFNGNGGRNINNEDEFRVRVPVNSTQILVDLEPKGADAFIRLGYTFRFWSEDPNATQGILTIDIGTSDVDVYAIWLLDIKYD